jgi:hypothetical protein
MAEEVRRLEVDEVRDRQERGVEAFAPEHDGERRLGLDHRVPRRDRVEVGEDHVGFGVDQVGERWIELLAAALTGEPLRRLDSAHAVCDLDVLRHLREPGRERNSLALELARPAAPVPSRVCRAERAVGDRSR